MFSKNFKFSHTSRIENFLFRKRKYCSKYWFKTTKSYNKENQNSLKITYNISRMLHSHPKMEQTHLYVASCIPQLLFYVYCAFCHLHLVDQPRLEISNYCNHKTLNGKKFSRVDQVKFVEDSL